MPPDTVQSLLYLWAEGASFFAFVLGICIVSAEKDRPKWYVYAMIGSGLWPLGLLVVLGFISGQLLKATYVDLEDYNGIYKTSRDE